MQRLPGRCANPARQLATRGLQITLQLLVALIQQQPLLVQLQPLGWRAAPFRKGRRQTVTLHGHGLPPLRQQGLALFQVIQFQPGQGRLQAVLPLTELAGGQRQADLRLRLLFACGTLGRVGHTLHDTQAPLGHGVLIETEAFAAIQRQVVQAEDQLWIGQFASSLADHLCGLQPCGSGFILRCRVQRQAQRVGIAQRLRRSAQALAATQQPKAQGNATGKNRHGRFSNAQ